MTITLEPNGRVIAARTQPLDDNWDPVASAGLVSEATAAGAGFPSAADLDPGSRCPGNSGTQSSYCHIRDA